MFKSLKKKNLNAVASWFPVGITCHKIDKLGDGKQLKLKKKTIEVEKELRGSSQGQEVHLDKYEENMKGILGWY